MQLAVKHLPADVRRAITVETVIALAGEQNPCEITTAAIAKRMGVTQGALFRHFANKEAILQAVVEWVAERLTDRIEKAVLGVSSPLAALEAIFMAHVNFVAEHPGIPRMLFGELQRPEETGAKRRVQQLVRGYKERLGQLVAEGKACGELDAGLEVEAATVLFLGSIQGLIMQSLLVGDVGRIRREAPRVFVIFRRGIGRGG